MNTCAICRNRFEAESPAVLFVSAYGTKRVLCSTCEDFLDRATAKEDSPEKKEALMALSTLAANIKDPSVIETLTAILSGDEDENAPSAEEEAEMEAVFEEIKKEEEEAALQNTQSSSLLDYLFPALFGAAILIFILWYFFFR